jgi:hypothetical protein
MVSIVGVHASLRQVRANVCIAASRVGTLRAVWQ